MQERLATETPYPVEQFTHLQIKKMLLFQGAFRLVHVQNGLLDAANVLREDQNVGFSTFIHTHSLPCRFRFCVGGNWLWCRRYNGCLLDNLQGF